MDGRISSEIANLREDLIDAYNSIQAKGGAIPLSKNTGGLSLAIDNIPTGGMGVSTMALQKCNYFDNRKAGKWLVARGNGEAVPQEITVDNYNLGNFLALDSKTGEIIYENSNVDFRNNNLWVPLYKVNIQEVDDEYTPLEETQTKWLCLRCDTNEDRWYICLMENFGNDVEKATLDDGRFYMLQREAMCIFTYNSIGYENEIEIELETLALEESSHDILPLQAEHVMDLKKCFSPNNSYDARVYSPMYMTSNLLSNLTDEYNYITYENDTFGYIGSDKKPLMMMSSAVLEDNIFDPLRYARGDFPILW